MFYEVVKHLNNCIDWLLGVE